MDTPNPLLPILQSQAAPMSLCEICPQPGRCCAGFNLKGSIFNEGVLWEHNWREESARLLAEFNLPFKPISIEAEYVGDEGKYGEVRYSCPKVTAEGRCGIYETRPKVCRIFVPAQNILCVMSDLTKRI